MTGVITEKCTKRNNRWIASGSTDSRLAQVVSASGAQAISSDPAADTADWPNPAQHLDNRELDPPEPMLRILAATETMSKGEVRSALLCHEPVFLIPELARRGHAWHGAFETNGKNSKILEAA